MKIISAAIASIKRKLENTQSDAEMSKSVIDYNVMMGVLEDPSEEEEETDE